MDRKEAMKLFQTTGIYGITAERLSAGRSNPEAAEQMLQGGIRFLQYREKKKSYRCMYEECQKIRELTRKYNAAFIVDDFVDLALAVEADGVHIGQDDLPPAVVRQLIGPSKVIGLSTHCPAQLEKANELADIVDYFGVGPVFPTQTKKNPAPVTGLSYVEYAVRHARCPFVAIGGIKEHNIASVAAAGAKTCAVVSAITGAADIAGTVQGLQAAMRQPAAC